MNMSTKPSSSKKNQIKPSILDRKTDKAGRTYYQVEWVNDSNSSNNITWQPVTNLKEHYKLIQDFENKYQERVTDWNPTYNSREHHQFDKQAYNSNSNYELGRNQNINGSQSLCKQTDSGFNRNIKILQDSKFNQIELDFDKFVSNKDKNREKCPQKDKDNSKNKNRDQNTNNLCINLQNNKQMQILISARQQIETFDKSSIGEQCNKNKQLIMMEENSKNQVDTTFQAMNQRITRLIRKDRKIKPKRALKIVAAKFHKPSKADLVKQQKVTKIKEIFVAGRVWWASVVMQGNIDKIVLRDQLRICQPQILLSFYENLLEHKIREVL